MRLVEHARAMLQHFDETRLVERRIGVRRTGEARHAAGDRRGDLGFERRLVLEARLAQPRGEVDEARRDDQSRSIDDAIGTPAGRRVADRGDPAVRDIDVADAIHAAARDR